MKQKIYKRKRIIPVGWKEIKLGDVFRTSSGATPLSTEKSYYEGGVIPWINSGELASPYIYKTSNYITQKGFENSSTELYPKDTVLVAMYGATAGKASLLKMEACTNQAICAILPNEDYCPEFIKYNIDTLYEHLVGLSSGSARDNLSQAGLKELKLVLPKTKKEQEKLVSVLSLLDRKIELNRQINDNLEAMAKQLYDYWFVQFDFPNEEGKPYKSSGGVMVWNEKLKREIPQGWDFCFLENLLTIRNGRDHKHLADGIYPVYGSGGEMRKVSEYLYDGESVLMPRKGSLNNIMYVNEAFWTVDTMFYSEMKLSNCAKYIYYTIKDIDFTRWDSGTGVPSMTSSTLYSIKLVKPQSEILKKFDKMISPLFEHMKQISVQNAELIKQRDELLPLLMNGQATVNYHLSVLLITKIMLYYKETNINFGYERNNNTKRFRWNESGSVS